MTTPTPITWFVATNPERDRLYRFTSADDRARHCAERGLTPVDDPDEEAVIVRRIDARYEEEDGTNSDTQADDYGE